MRVYNSIIKMSFFFPSTIQSGTIDHFYDVDFDGQILAEKNLCAKTQTELVKLVEDGLTEFFSRECMSEGQHVNKHSFFFSVLSVLACTWCSKASAK